MLLTKSILLPLAALVASTEAAPASYAELKSENSTVQSPVDGYVFVPGSSDCGCGVFNLRALDGQQSVGSQYFVQATLIDHNSNNSTLILPATPFDGFVVDKQIALASANFNPGVYDLVVVELDSEGKVSGSVTQSFTVAAQ